MENKILYLNDLYDYYGNLLTSKQQEYFEDYYLNNLTLSEIAENNNISRNAIHKQIKDAESKLEMFEENLKLLEKRKQIEKLIKDLDKNLKEQIEELI
ncbi:MAG: hypothetical protein E7169_01105 [Firmicutes bacterium]|nr:hypothetical protein [Bacillota bacterium]